MNFWNDYEGKTIAGKFPLERLLYPEGRSGFFFTTNGTGTPAVIRITESMNDQAAMLEPWRIVRSLRQSNLVTIKDFGEDEVDETPLLFTVMETTDINLAEVLRDRAMTEEETLQIADSLIAALDGLHRNGLVHGHVEAANVFAVGEVIKLRSDCVRTSPAGAEGERLIVRDTHDLSVLLLQCLTQQRTQQHLGLPTPFDEIIRNGIGEVWGLNEISNALHPVAGQPAPRLSSPVSLPIEMDPIAEIEEAFPALAPPEAVEHVDPADRLYPPEEAFPREPGPWIVVGLLLGSVVFGGWLFAHFHKQKPVPLAVVQQSVPSVIAPSPAVVLANPAPTVAEAPRSPAAADTRSVAPATGEMWRVVAYTYNQESQAQNKVAAIRKKHNSMQPEVFSPNGQAPFLVTLGGAMTRERATAMKKKAHSAGFPRDTYAQNYPVKE